MDARSAHLESQVVMLEKRGNEARARAAAAERQVAEAGERAVAATAKSARVDDIAAARDRLAEEADSARAEAERRREESTAKDQRIRALTARLEEAEENATVAVRDRDQQADTLRTALAEAQERADRAAALETEIARLRDRTVAEADARVTLLQSEQSMPASRSPTCVPAVSRRRPRAPTRSRVEKLEGEPPSPASARSGPRRLPPRPAGPSTSACARPRSRSWRCGRS